MRITDIAAVILAAVAIWNPTIKLGGGSTPAPAIPAPTAELQAIVAPIAALVTGDKATADRPELSAFFAALAEFHARDKATLIKTTDQLRAHNEAASLGMFQRTGIKDRTPGLAAAIEKGLGTWLGILQSDGKYKAQAFDAAASTKAAEFYAALAWAFSQPLPTKG